MKFKSLKLHDWKQFGDVNINFHPNLTILTGANASGKTTILNLLAQHFGWNFQELSTPAKDKKSGIFRFFTRFFKKSTESNDFKIGELTYDDNSAASLEVPDLDSPQYSIQIKNRQPLAGLNIPSPRPIFTYQPVSQLSIKKRKKQEAFSLVSNSIKEKVLGGGGGHPSSYYIKETLITWAIFGHGNKAIEADEEQVEYYNGFQEILRKILPKSLGFKEFSIRNAEVVLITDSGDFMLDAVSGGIGALIELAWQIYMFSTKEVSEFVVLIDEVENHLHATMQRAILPDFLIAFPNVQFIVSTHNPLIVGSVKDSNVYVLKYNKNNKVDSLSLDLVNKAKTASEILREVLGVPFSMPIWVEDKLNEITGKYSSAEINEANFNAMRGELAEMGLESLVPQTISEILDKNKKHDQD
ncbi:AAA family ATPase [Patescibacteria group bacterium AH-259-L07]|nr:AAA family ATPase [Patescibacteria group bacterium AH-259-L07]